MPGWPSLGRVEDRRLTQSLIDGDVDALANVYDAYASRVFDYCHALLRDQESAADAMHNAFLAAQAHITKLREPERFRSWLYALARNECVRLLHDPDRAVERNEAPEDDGAFLDAEEKAHRAETRQFVHSALSGLTGRQRETIDLTVRHDLDPQELGGVIGVSAAQATELAADAREELDNALAAAIVARTGRSECPSVAALVDTREWPLTPAVCKKLVRHIEVCPTCTEGRTRKVSAARLMQVLPSAALPPDLRTRVLSSASAPELAEERADIARDAEPFDVWGWPTPAEQARRAAQAGSGVPRLWPAVGAAAGVILMVGLVFLLLPGSSDTRPSGSAESGAAPVPGDSSFAFGPSEDPSAETTTAQPTPTKTPTKSPSPTPKKKAKKTPRPPVETSTRPQQPRPNPSLSISSDGCGGIGGGSSCTITLTASNGSMQWSAAASDYLSLSDGGGTVSPGSPHQITVFVDRNSACPLLGNDTESGSVWFSPGGTVGVRWRC